MGQSDRPWVKPKPRDELRISKSDKGCQRGIMLGKAQTGTAPNPSQTKAWHNHIGDPVCQAGRQADRSMRSKQTDGIAVQPCLSGRFFRNERKLGLWDGRAW